jgi:hypothetical protein
MDLRRLPAAAPPIAAAGIGLAAGRAARPPEVFE